MVNRIFSCWCNWHKSEGIFSKAVEDIPQHLNPKDFRPENLGLVAWMRNDLIQRLKEATNE